jgi:hypothetical protein
MATLGNPVVVFNQGTILKGNDPGMCCRLGYKWLASKVAPAKVKGGSFKFDLVNYKKTSGKQGLYLNDADPYEKENAVTWRLGVGVVTLKWLNIWGERHGLAFEKITGVHDCKGYFANYSQRSALIGIFGRDAKGGNWAHATAYYAGGPAFFDANEGEFDLSGVPNPGSALDTFHLYLKGTGETLDDYSFFPLL